MKFKFIFCRSCGWMSKHVPETMAGEVFGVPWYCDECGKRVQDFVVYAPSEQEQAIAEANRTISFWQSSYLQPK